MKLKEIFIKALIYRFMAFCIIVVISYIFTGNYETSLLIAIVGLAIKTIFYIGYELVWKKVIMKYFIRS